MVTFIQLDLFYRKTKTDLWSINYCMYEIDAHREVAIQKHGNMALLAQNGPLTTPNEETIL